MRIAILSDIHGNYFALEAVLADIKQAGADKLVCLGDAIQGGPQPAETVACLRDLKCPTVMGNSDAWLLAGKTAATTITAQNLTANHYIARDWSLAQLSAQDCEFIAQFQPTIEIVMSDTQKLLCFHGSPRSYDDNILPTTLDTELLRLLGDDLSFLFTGGHVHSQLLRRIDDTYYFRPGSVGRVYDRNRTGASHRLDPWAEYAILTSNGIGWALEFRRVTIDIAKLSSIWLKTGRPDAEKEASLYRR